MGKKKPKNRSSSSKSFNTFNENSSVGDQSVLSETSLENSEETSKGFKVLLYPELKDKWKYMNPKADEPQKQLSDQQWLGSQWSWKNIAFLHPSVMSTLQCGTFICVEGNENSSIYIAYPLRTVNKSHILLLNSYGFKEKEFVTIHPFEGEGYEAKEIYIHIPPEFDNNDKILNFIKKRLSNTFIWPGLKFKLTVFGNICEFTILNINSTGIISHRNFLKNDFDGSSDQCASQIFPSLTLENTKNDGELDMVTENSKLQIPRFFTTSFKTVLICDKKLEITKSSLMFEHFGGYKTQINEIKAFIDAFLNASSKNALMHDHFLLISGPSGIGKTMLLKSIFNEYSFYTEDINLKKLLTENPFAVYEIIEQKVKNRGKRSPTILLLDDFHLLYPSSSEYSREADKMYNILSSCITNVLIVATVSADFKCEKRLVESVSVKEIKFPLPSDLEREEIMSNIFTTGIQHDISSSDLKECAKFSEGLNGREIFNAISYDSTILSLIRIKNTANSTEPILIMKDLKTALKNKKTSLITSNLKVEKVKWSDIGGMDSVKEMLITEVEFFKMAPEVLKRYNYQPNRGILLYGPPGCSKTMIAKAVATECSWNFISKKSSELLNMYVGESEKAITELFRKAKERSPCIIFLDEIDALASERESTTSGSGVGNRIVATLLTEMDGFEDLKNVMVIAATNRPNIIDAALLRYGRLGKHIYVPLPDHATRREIFKISMKRRSIKEDVDINKLVEKTEGYTGAEIVHLCNEAAIQLLLEDSNCQSPVFTMEHFEKALLAVPPRTPKKLIEFYERFHLSAQ